MGAGLPTARILANSPVNDRIVTRRPSAAFGTLASDAFSHGLSLVNEETITESLFKISHAVAIEVGVFAAHCHAGKVVENDVIEFNLARLQHGVHGIADADKALVQPEASRSRSKFRLRESNA